MGVHFSIVGLPKLSVVVSGESMVPVAGLLLFGLVSVGVLLGFVLVGGWQLLLVGLLLVVGYGG